MRFLLGAGERLLDVQESDGEIDERVAFSHPLGRNLKCLAASEDRERLAIGFYEGGVFLSGDAGRDWKDITGDLPISHISSCAIDPVNRDRIYVGTNPSALFVTEDEGKHWREIESLRNHPNARIWSNPRGPSQLRSIAVSPADSRVIFAAIEVGDLLKSEDGGRSWWIADGVCHDQHKVLLSLSDPDLVFLMTGADSSPYGGENGYGFFMSRDAGRTWKNTNDQLSAEKHVYAEDAIVLLPADPKTMFVAIADGTPPNWRGPRTESDYFVAPSRDKREKGADVSIHRSKDGGERWISLNGGGGLPPSFFDAVWALDAGEDAGAPVICFGTTAGEVWRSGDGGDTWQSLPKTFPPISHLLLL